MFGKTTLGKALLIGVVLGVVVLGVRADQKALDETAMEDLVGGVNCYNWTLTKGCVSKTCHPQDLLSRTPYDVPKIIAGDSSGWYGFTIDGQTVGCLVEYWWEYCLTPVDYSYMYNPTYSMQGPGCTDP